MGRLLAYILFPSDLLCVCTFERDLKDLLSDAELEARHIFCTLLGISTLHAVSQHPQTGTARLLPAATGPPLRLSSHPSGRFPYLAFPLPHSSLPHPRPCAHVHTIVVPMQRRTPRTPPRKVGMYSVGPCFSPALTQSGPGPGCDHIH